MNGSRADRLAQAALILGALALASPGFGSGKTLAGVDAENVFHYQNALIGTFLREGAIPNWDPHVMCGFPLLAAGQSAFFYPFTWALAVLDPGPYWTFTVFAHLALSGLFMFAWLRRGIGVDSWAAALGATVYMLAGTHILRVEAGHANYLMASPWLPALFWRLEKYLEARSIPCGASVGVVAGLLLLTGVIQLAFAGALVALARLLFEGVTANRWKDVGRAAAWASLGALLAAPQLLTTLELVGESQRISIRSYDFVTSCSLPLENLLTFLAPTFFGDHASVPYWGKSIIWEFGGFVSVAALLLAGLGLGSRHRLRMFWAAAAVVALLLSLGRHTPIFRLFHAIIPGAGLFRGPGRYLAIFALAVAALAALGFQRLLEDPAGTRRAGAQMGLIGLALAAVLGTGWMLLPGPQGAWSTMVRAVDDGTELNMVSSTTRSDPGLLQTTHAGARRALAEATLWTALLGGALLAFGKGRLAAPSCGAALSMVLALELLSFGARHFRARDTTLREWPAELVKHLEGRPETPSRIASAGMGNEWESGQSRAAGLDHVGGYEPLLLRRYCELINSISGHPADQPVVLAMPWEPHPALAMLNVRRLLYPKDTKLPEGLRVSGGVGDRLICDVPSGLPRCWMVTEARIVPDAAERLRILADPAFDPRRIVVLEEPAAPSEGPPGTARLLARGPGEYVIEASSERGGILVLSESWYPGWGAQLDGAPVVSLRANHLLQAVIVPAGTHRVRFVYRSRFLGWGFALFALGVGVPVALVLIRRHLEAGHSEPT